MIDRRNHERAPAAFQVRVTSVTSPELTAIGEASDISKFGIGVNIPIHFTMGSLVRLDIADSSLCGFVAYSRKWAPPSDTPFARNKVWVGGAESSEYGAPPDLTVYQTGIEVVEALIGVSGLSQLLKVTLENAMPHLELAHAERA
jgi:hypothetical protein